jgi:hypothetical protein
MRFNDVQAAGEARIAAAAGVPAIVAQIQAGLDSGTYANYEQAMRAFANGTLADLWSSAVAALAKFVTAPTGARLWYDTGNIPALQDAETARAEAAQVNAAALSTLITAGYEPDAAVGAINAGDLALLTGQHSGLVSVQMQAPGSTPQPKPTRELHVNVDARQKPPVVHSHTTVEPAAVEIRNTYEIDAKTTVEPAEVTVDARSTPHVEVTVPPAPLTRKRIETDEDGRITAVVEERDA